jgi:hypothetical protein
MKLLYFVIILKTVVYVYDLNSDFSKQLFFKENNAYVIASYSFVSMKTEFDNLMGVKSN